MLIFLNVILFSIKIGQVLEFRGLATVMDTFILNMDRESMLGTDAFEWHVWAGSNAVWLASLLLVSTQ